MSCRCAPCPARSRLGLRTDCRPAPPSRLLPSRSSSPVEGSTQGPGELPGSAELQLGHESLVRRDLVAVVAVHRKQVTTERVNQDGLPPHGNLGSGSPAVTD